MDYWWVDQRRYVTQKAILMILHQREKMQRKTGHMIQCTKIYQEEWRDLVWRSCRSEFNSWWPRREKCHSNQIPLKSKETML